MYLTYFIILAFSTFFFSAVGTGLALFLLRRSSLIDQPNERSNHVNPTPTGGGIALIVSLLGFMVVSAVPASLVCAAILLAVISFLDDKYDMLPGWRLVFQALAVALALNALPHPVFQGVFSPFFDKLLAGILWLWVINLTNFMDGIDGITGSQGIALAIGICLLGLATPDIARSLPLEAALVGAACGGFLLWNWHPAKLFMGDVGSVPLGLIFGYLLLLLAGEGYWAAALILPAYYLADATVTISRRFLRGEKIWQAHSQHFYQQAVRSGRSHDAVVKDIAKINLGLILLALISSFKGEFAAVCLVGAYIQVALFLRYLSKPVAESAPPALKAV